MRKITKTALACLALLGSVSMSTAEASDVSSTPAFPTKELKPEQTLGLWKSEANGDVTLNVFDPQTNDWKPAVNFKTRYWDKARQIPGVESFSDKNSDDEAANKLRLVANSFTENQTASGDAIWSRDCKKVFFQYPNSLWAEPPKAEGLRKAPEFIWGGEWKKGEFELTEKLKLPVPGATGLIWYDSSSKAWKMRSADKKSGKFLLWESSGGNESELQWKKIGSVSFAECGRDNRGCEGTHIFDNNKGRTRCTERVFENMSSGTVVPEFLQESKVQESTVSLELPSRPAVILTGRLEKGVWVPNPIDGDEEPLMRYSSVELRWPDQTKVKISDHFYEHVLLDKRFLFVKHDSSVTSVHIPSKKVLTVRWVFEDRYMLLRGLD